MQNYYFYPFPPPDPGASRGWNPPGHLGIDFLTPVGTPLLAAADGEVIYVGDEPSGYGNTVTIRHNGNEQSRYAHLSLIYASRGDEVAAGDPIGLSGGAKGAQGAGNSDGPHLHFEIRSDPNTPVDPAPLLQWPISAQGIPKPTGDDDMTPDEHAWLEALYLAVSAGGPGVPSVQSQTVAVIPEQINQVLKKLEDAPPGAGLSEQQVRGIVRQELDRATKPA